MNRIEYEKIIKENFDIEHTETRKALLALDEADQNSVLTSLATKLYDNIIHKVDDIDFGSIPKSQGDITKIENYEELMDCIETIKSLLDEYRQPTKPIDTVITAVNNLKTRKDLFEKSYKYNIELPMITYSTMTLSVVSSVSFLIATCIEFIKVPNQDHFHIVLDKVAMNKSKQNLLFTNLDRFNRVCANGQLDDCLDYAIKKNIKNLTGMGAGALAGLAVASVLILNIIPILRELIFFFYYSRTRISDYLELQSNLLKMSAYNIENNEAMPKKDRTQISKKQSSIAEKLQKISNFFSIDAKKAEKDSDKEITGTNKHYKITDVVDSLPDSASSAIF